MLQRRTAGIDTAATVTNTAPPIVHDVLRSPGQPLDRATRSFFEPRFGYDFSHVRVHTDARAAESARAVNALAYTAGKDIVFETGQFLPETKKGRSLLAHELTHVLQGQNNHVMREYSGVSSALDATEIEADATAKLFEHETRAIQATLLPGGVRHAANAGKLSRRVNPKALDCKGGVNQAPPDPLATLTEADAHAEALANATSNLLIIASVVPDADNDLTRSYKALFGAPPKVAHGYLDRLHGTVKKTFAEAFGTELEARAARFERLAEAFRQPIRYRCVSGAVTRDGCDTPGCTHAEASACENISSIFLCPAFWNIPDNRKATLLIHEAVHMVYGLIEKDAKSGAKSSRAECYASFVSDIFNMPRGGPPCPAP